MKLSGPGGIEEIANRFFAAPICRRGKKDKEEKMQMLGESGGRMKTRFRRVWVGARERRLFGDERVCHDCVLSGHEFRYV